MINIIIDKQGRPSKSSIFLGNQHENLDETLQFFFPKEYEDHYRYIAYCYKDRRTGKKITGISPLVEDAFKVTSAITKCAGMWQLYVICKTTQIDEKATIIDLTANNSTGEHIFISDAINGRISGNEIDIEAFENIAVDENIKILYDDILSLKLRVEKNEEARQSQENIRQTAETNRANAETERVIAEQSRSDNEVHRTQSEESRVTAESKRVEVEKARVKSETLRGQSETARVNAENIRAEAEKSRVNAEGGRVSAENERVKSETLRKQSEQTRSNEESTRQSAERTRVSEESTRKNAENARVSAEQSRVSVESQRVSAETNRANAERLRSEAETSRINAEQSRADAEQLRVSAENERVTAENARAEAESKREGVISKLREDLDNNTKLDQKTVRSLTALWDLNKGISYRFEEDNKKAYTKGVPSGAKLGAVNAIGGKTIVYNQLIDPSRRKEIDFDEQTKHFKYSDWTVTAGNKYICTGINAISGHKYYLYATDKVRHAFLYMYGDSVSIAFTKPEDAETEVKSIFTATNSGKNQVYFNRYLANPENVSYFDGCINLIDLTQMFGEGNEPTTTEEFESMFPNSYYPYNEGTLMSMSVNEVEEVGKNIFKCENFSCYGLDGTNKPALSNSYGTSINNTEPSNSVTVTQSKAANEDVATNYENGYFCVSFKPLTMNGKYVFSFDITPSNKLISSPKFMVLFNGNVNYGSAIVDTQSLQIGIKSKLFFTLNVNNKKVKYIEIRNGGISGIFENFQIEEGSTNTTFSPYHENHYAIPQAILDLDGYGWGVGNVYNYVDYENKKFYKYVNRVDLGTFTEIYVYSGLTPSDGRYIYAVNISDAMVKDSSSAIHELFNSISFDDLTSKDGMFLNVAYNQLLISTNKCKSVEELKAYINNKYFYYELAEPIVTDISDIIEDTFQEPFNVESGGSLTFKNSNGNGYQVAVPSDIQYVVSLKEVNP